MRSFCVSCPPDSNTLYTSFADGGRCPICAIVELFSFAFTTKTIPHSGITILPLEFTIVNYFCSSGLDWSGFLTPNIDKFSLFRDFNYDIWIFRVIIAPSTIMLTSHIKNHYHPSRASSIPSDTDGMKRRVGATGSMAGNGFSIRDDMFPAKPADIETILRSVIQIFRD